MVDQKVPSDDARPAIAISKDGFFFKNPSKNWRKKNFTVYFLESNISNSRGRQHSFVEIDHEIFSTVILSLPLIQEGQLSVSGDRMCTILVNRLED